MSAFDLVQSKLRRVGSAANAIALPEAKPRAVREHRVVSSIGGRNVTFAEGPDIRRLKHFSELLDVVNDAFDVHCVQISNISAATVKWSCIRLPSSAILRHHGFGLDIAPVHLYTDWAHRARPMARTEQDPSLKNLSRRDFAGKLRIALTSLLALPVFRLSSAPSAAQRTSSSNLPQDSGFDRPDLARENPPDEPLSPHEFGRARHGQRRKVRFRLSEDSTEK